MATTIITTTTTTTTTTTITTTTATAITKLSPEPFLSAQEEKSQYHFTGWEKKEASHWSASISRDTPLGYRLSGDIGAQLTGGSSDSIGWRISEPPLAGPLAASYPECPVESMHEAAVRRSRDVSEGFPEAVPSRPSTVCHAWTTAKAPPSDIGMIKYCWCFVRVRNALRVNVRRHKPTCSLTWRVRVGHCGDVTPSSPARVFRATRRCVRNATREETIVVCGAASHRSIAFHCIIPRKNVDELQGTCIFL
ncbi:hypothetical protein E2C01_032236 [Portunus trituberculatus]|uniref:Uncharacterized protein n=1 Tax=Portunus trituberculatus TaxID=210409 RepID=A0A5B7F296_PORTR|nr:hypothetical protein [Portunus trituberculatus]